MRSTSVAIGVTAVMASGLTGCASSPDYAAVCVDPQTNQRVDDDECDRDHYHSGVGSAFLWYYLGRSAAVPAVGRTVTGGNFSIPRTGTIQRGGLPVRGGSSVKSTTTRGGFGGSHHGFSS
jgi:hypothetical protein